LAIIAVVVGVVAAQFTEMPAAVPDAPQHGPKNSAPVLAPSMTVAESLRTKSFWFFWLTWALQGAAGIAMVTLSTQFGLSLGLALGSAVVILTAFNVTNGLSRLLMGHLSDVVGRNAAMSVTFYAAAAAYFILPHVNGVVTAAVLAAIIGFAFGTLFAVSAPLASDCFGLAHFGSIFGVVFTAYGFAAGPLGPWFSGYLLDATNGNFVVVFSYLGLFCALSGVFIRFVVPPHVRR
jgi:OFA family oxalate/formate antiporter-like MFS transporter